MAMKTLHELGRHTLRYLDGRRDNAALVELLLGLIETKVLVLPEGATKGKNTRPYLEETLTRTLGYLTYNALLFDRA